MNASQDERSISQLFGDSIAQLTKLVQNEVDLARAELVQKTSLTASAAKFMAVGAMLCVPALTLIFFAIAAELVVLGLSQPLAYLCVGVVALLVAGALAWAGASRLSGGALKPSVTLREIERDKAMATELMR